MIYSQLYLFRINILTQSLAVISKDVGCAVAFEAHLSEYVGRIWM